MKNRISYLQFYKYVLERVKFDSKLFRKEYNKAIKYLNQDERKDLDHWINGLIRSEY